MCNIQDRTTELFDKCHVTSFIYVDDKFGEPSDAKNECKVFVGEHLSEVDFIYHNDIWEDEFEEWWKSSTEEVRTSFITQWKISVESADDLQNKFKQILPKAVSQKYLLPNEFQSQVEDLLKNVDETHTTVMLFDHRLDGFGRDGEDLLDKVVNNPNVFCALFSATFNEEEEMNRWNMLSDKENAYTFAKNRLSYGNDNDIIDGIRYILWARKISSLKDYSLQTYESAISFLTQQLNSIDPVTFHKIILDRSEEEGCWEFKTIDRILTDFFRMGVKNSLLEGGYVYYQKLISAIRDLKKDTKSKLCNTTILGAINREEVYDEADYINSTFSQICNGDIFRINECSDYMLLCQPCNLEIRTNGKRTDPDFDQFYLVPIVDYIEDNRLNNKTIALQNVEGESKKMVNLSKYKRISLSVLDLVSYNKEGIARIDLRTDSSNHLNRSIIQNNMLKRFDIIKNKVLNHKRQYDVVNNLELEKIIIQEMSAYFCRPFELGDTKVTKHPKLKDHYIVDFNLRRVRRYKDPYAKDLLTFFMNYLSRPGYPMTL